MRITPAVPVLVAITVMVGTAGCSDTPAGDPDPTVSSTPTTPATPEASASTRKPTMTSTTIPEGSAPPFPANTVPSDGGLGSGNGLGVTEVRTGRHRGYDRVVFDLGGTGTPGWYASYTTNPRYEGSGDPVTLNGETFLMVFLRGVGMAFDTGLEPFDDDTTRLPGTGTQGIAEIAPGGVFEGEQQAFIALTGAKRPFRVFVLRNPARLIVDVAHSEPAASPQYRSVKTTAV